jgi:hypothetical protein
MSRNAKRERETLTIEQAISGDESGYEESGMDMEEIMQLEDSTHYTVHLQVRVDDPEALLEAAISKYREHRDIDVKTARADFELADGSIDVGACLVCLYEPDESAPGTELEETECEAD